MNGHRNRGLAWLDPENNTLKPKHLAIWWLNQPNWEYAQVKIGSWIYNFQGEHQKNSWKLPRLTPVPLIFSYVCFLEGIQNMMSNSSSFQRGENERCFSSALINYLNKVTKKGRINMGVRFTKRYMVTLQGLVQCWESVPRFEHNSSWWFQPIRKILVKMGSSSPNSGQHQKNIWNHHLESCCVHLNPCLKIMKKVVLLMIGTHSPVITFPHDELFTGRKKQNTKHKIQGG